MESWLAWVVGLQIGAVLPTVHDASGDAVDSVASPSTPAPEQPRNEIELKSANELAASVVLLNS